MPVAAGLPADSGCAGGTGAGFARLEAVLVLATPATVVVTCFLTFLVPGVLHGTAVMNGSARGTALTMLLHGVPVLAHGAGQG